MEAPSDADRLQAFAPIQEMMTYVQFANDECDYGMGLELGLGLGPGPGLGSGSGPGWGLVPRPRFGLGSAQKERPWGKTPQS